MLPFGTLTRGVGPRNYVLDGGSYPQVRRGNFDGKNWPAQDMLGPVWWLIYSKWLSRGQNQYGADANWGVLEGAEQNSAYAAAMRTYVKLLWPLVCVFVFFLVVASLVVNSTAVINCLEILLYSMTVVCQDGHYMLLTCSLYCAVAIFVVIYADLLKVCA